MNQVVDVILYVLMQEKGVNSDAIYEVIQSKPVASLPTVILTEVLRICKRQWLSVAEKLVGKERAKQIEKPPVCLTDKRLDLVAAYEFIVSLLLKEKESMNMKHGSGLQDTDNFDRVLESASQNYTNPFYCVELKQFTYFVKPFQSLQLAPYFTDEQLESICDRDSTERIFLKAVSVSTGLPLPWHDLAYVRFQGRLVPLPAPSEPAEHPSLDFWVSDAISTFNSHILSIISSYANPYLPCLFVEGIDLTEEFKIGAGSSKQKIQIQVTSIGSRPFVTRLCVVRKSSVLEVADRINKGPLGSFVKGMYCRHAEEVDLFYFLDSMYQKRDCSHWCCFWCGVSLHPLHMIPSRRQRLAVPDDYQYPFKTRDSHLSMLL